MRQSLAQNNHMNDMLKLQQNQLIEEFKQVMEERAGFERSTYVDSLAKHIARVDGLVTTTSGVYPKLSFKYLQARGGLKTNPCPGVET